MHAITLPATISLSFLSPKSRTKFLTVLELVKVRAIRIFQEQAGGEIMIEAAADMCNLHSIDHPTPFAKEQAGVQKLMAAKTAEELAYEEYQRQLELAIENH